MAFVWFWKGGGGIFRTRELVYELGKDWQQVRSLDAQIRDASGALALRHQVSGDPALPGSTLVRKVHLESGDYKVDVFLRRTGQAAEQHVARTLHVGDGDTLVVSLDGP